MNYTEDEIRAALVEMGADARRELNVRRAVCKIQLNLPLSALSEDELQDLVAVLLSRLDDHQGELPKGFP